MVMSAKLLIIGLAVALLGACEAKREHTMSREHDAKANLLCKRDNGLKRVIDANGASFTAECNSGIIVTGTTN